MKPIIYDVETTTFEKGSPFSRRNKLVLGGLHFDESFLYFDSFPPDPVQELLTKDCLLVGFNLKFDVHWGRNVGLDFSKVKVWDCQLAEFILSNQTNVFPSLDDCLRKYEMPLKLDIVKTEYWDKGIDTDEVPIDILLDYLNGDLRKTRAVFLKQLEEFNERPQALKLFRLQCADLMVLEDMEYNGLLYDEEEAEKRAKELEIDIQNIETELRIGYDQIPINFDSVDHVSCYLYGGTIVEERRMPIGVFKTGLKEGQPRHKIVKFNYALPPLVKPLKGSELQKEGYYSTDEGTLRSLKANRQSRKRIDLILKRSRLQKLRGTYYLGIPSLNKEMDWEDGRIFGQYNQCVARTGRIASSKPNQQNLAPEFKQLIVSRFT